ncbi:methyltransferase, FkbM family [Rivularia sp. PCC 7116]|uniref:FkbM family methyltransferase n=1 Tax=Rivularia sp. PCC 7116 TaxID=373994 RepID=UPI00029EE08E|nr:FkbM family methyltransferase [Rivularia sp. PCC 7116]AFY58610.1 methyltransferase, FkbM family [Rivularia sp. PCC 7116]
MALKHINYQPTMTEFLVNKKTFSKNPLLVMDIGARGGFEHHWQSYGEQVYKIGFEPDKEECDRLNQQPNRNSKFYAVALGEKREKRTFSFCQWGGSSGFYPGNKNFLKRFPHDNLEMMEVVKTLDIETVDLDSFVADNKIDEIDFIKLDVEGSELDVLKGAVSCLNESVLGLSIEVLFHESIRNQPTFSHIDLFLNSLGFRLFDLATYRHARKALPLPMISQLGNTKQGQVLWAQALYLRDAVNELETKESANKWNKLKILKLASLMEIFCLPDCAVELIQIAAEKNILTEDLELFLNYLTPPIQKEGNSEYISYQNYLKLF